MHLVVLVVEAGWNAPEPVYGSGNTPTDPNHPQVQGYRGGI